MSPGKTAARFTAFILVQQRGCARRELASVPIEACVGEAVQLVVQRGKARIARALAAAFGLVEQPDDSITRCISHGRQIPREVLSAFTSACDVLQSYGIPEASKATSS